MAKLELLLSSGQICPGEEEEEGEGGKTQFYCLDMCVWYNNMQLFKRQYILKPILCYLTLWHNPFLHLGYKIYIK